MKENDSEHDRITTSRQKRNCKSTFFWRFFSTSEKRNITILFYWSFGS